MQLSLTSDEIAAIVHPRASRGATSAMIHGISALGNARTGDLSFLNLKSAVTHASANESRE